MQRSNSTPHRSIVGGVLILLTESGMIYLVFIVSLTSEKEKLWSNDVVAEREYGGCPSVRVFFCLPLLFRLVHGNKAGRGMCLPSSVACSADPRMTGHILCHSYCTGRAAANCA
jgi:hypothetical protein